VLNRITGQDPSVILGALQSNGKVFLINPNGVLFGAGSRVDVNGLVASSLNISNADFLAGKNNFNGAANAGKVSNQGTITTPSGGQIFLIAPAVENSGMISAPNGEVVLAAGHGAAVRFQRSECAGGGVVAVRPGAEPGQVVAQGGRVGVYGALVNQRGSSTPTARCAAPMARSCSRPAAPRWWKRAARPAPPAATSTPAAISCCWARRLG
jgi:large exoprotein involved in heme utilization and adhesion